VTLVGRPAGGSQDGGFKHRLPCILSLHALLTGYLLSSPYPGCKAQAGASKQWPPLLGWDWEGVGRSYPDCSVQRNWRVSFCLSLSSSKKLGRGMDEGLNSQEVTPACVH
jgi:hypothetical protein